MAEHAAEDWPSQSISAASLGHFEKHKIWMC